MPGVSTYQLIENDAGQLPTLAHPGAIKEAKPGPGGVITKNGLMSFTGIHDSFQLYA
jgi:hypothetical protein